MNATHLFVWQKFFLESEPILTAENREQPSCCEPVQQIFTNLLYLWYTGTALQPIPTIYSLCVWESCIWCAVILLERAEHIVCQKGEKWFHSGIYTYIYFLWIGFRYRFYRNPQYLGSSELHDIISIVHARKPYLKAFF